MENTISHKVITRPGWFVLGNSVLFLSWFADSFYGPKVVLAAFFLGLLLINPGIGAVRSSPLRIPAALLIIWSFAGLLILGRTRFAGGNMLGLTGALLILLIISGSDPQGLRRGVIVSAGAAVAAVSIYSVLQFYGIGLIEKFQGAPLPYSTFGNRNYVADFIVLFLPLILFNAGRKRPLMLICAGFALWALLLTRSWRIIPAAAAASLTLILLTEKKSRRVLTVFSAVIVLSGISAVLLSSERIYEKHLRPRTFMWRVGLEMFREAPLTGQGTGTFAWLYPDFQSEFLSRYENKHLAGYAASPARANNEYVHTAAERGVIGLLLFIWLIACWFKNADFSDKKFVIPAAAGVSGVLASAFFGFPLHRPETVFALAVIMGISVRNNKIPRAESGFIRVFSVLLAVTAFSTGILFSVSQVLAEKAAREFKAGGYEEASRLAGRAALFSPLPGRALFLKGRADFRRGLYEDSVLTYTLALETYNNVALYYNRALAYLGKGMLPEAERDLERSISIIPSYKPAVILMANINERKTGRGDK